MITEFDFKIRTELETIQNYLMGSELSDIYDNPDLLTYVNTRDEEIV